MRSLHLGIDIGAETIKLVTIADTGNGVEILQRRIIEHHKQPLKSLREALEQNWGDYKSAAVTGRLGRLLTLPRIPVKSAVTEGFKNLCGEDQGATIVSIGCHGFFVLELRDNGRSVLRENSRCSQGTGNFLRQLIERFDITLEEAAQLSADVKDPAELSGRCPVILKTDMTHLANKGENKDKILAGLYDAVFENVQVLIKPGIAPPRMHLIGGVARAKRIRDSLADFCLKHEMEYVDIDCDDGLFMEATGAAIEAGRRPSELPSFNKLFATDCETSFEQLPALSDSLAGVNRKKAQTFKATGADLKQVVLGLDMGSTGSKITALNSQKEKPFWEGYTNTNGDPVGASRKLVESFIEQFGDRARVVGIGVTGSGREIVGSLLSCCYGSDQVFILNEIAAHARGATYYDPEVDTIFEIGGQDAKYIRLNDGKVYDAAMNEACSAGTGSFIAEQGNKFDNVDDVIALGELALASPGGISLGQHCSVFMAEIIDSAVGAGVEQGQIISGIYDSIIQNYLNRVKGSRSVGDKIFCQGMPFSSDALAAAVVRQTSREVIVPPNPGTVGALGISLLATDEIKLEKAQPLDLAKFVAARVIAKDTFNCKSSKGCGTGNKCRIDRLTTQVAGRKQKFLWGGSCSLYDRGMTLRKLPNLSPDPFREREQLIEQIVERVTNGPSDGPTIGMTDEFALKSLFPFFAEFISRLGVRPIIIRQAGRDELKKGIDNSNVALCAPMQIYGGVVDRLVAADPDYILLPMVRDLPRAADEANSTTCPLAQASPDMLRHELAGKRTKIIEPVIDMDQGNFNSPLFKKCCKALAKSLNKDLKQFEKAFKEARRTQLDFEDECRKIGDRAFAFCTKHDVPPVVVLGRAYTIYNDVLNSNVPNLLREQGAMAIPVDCYRIEDDPPVFTDIYWGYSQLNLRAAHSIRRRNDVYSLFCSNYSCGPDSFNLHFYSYIMENKPFAIIETDGHSGDAGTKTRVEAFLYCVETDRNATDGSPTRPRTRLQDIESRKSSLTEAKKEKRIVIIPRMGENSEVVTAALRAEGMLAEALPMPTRETVRLGRRFTSGKECIPMTISIGSVLERVLTAKDDERFTLFIPTASGPCRFGVYNLLHKIIYSRLDLDDRLTVISPPDHDYFEGTSAGFAVKLMAGFVAGDVLDNMLHDVRPIEKVRGGANAIYKKYFTRLCRMMENSPAPEMLDALKEVATGLFGTPKLIEDAAREFAAIKDFDAEIPAVSVVGEIYVRCDPFANDFVIERLEKRGIRVRFAPFNEWIEYTDWLNYKKIDEGRLPDKKHWLEARVASVVAHTIIDRLYWVARRDLGLPERTSVLDSLAAAEGYLDPNLHGEAVLTFGGPVHEYLQGEVSGVVSVGPLECMPSKIAESQYYHASEKFDLPALTVYVNGDQVDDEILDNFAYDVKTRFERDIERNDKHDYRPLWLDRPVLSLGRKAAIYARYEFDTANYAVRNELTRYMNWLKPLRIDWENLQPSKEKRSSWVFPFFNK
jgi:predicted CoA-substrate-specific enzyme activase